jgi:hypothetical protein
MAANHRKQNSTITVFAESIHDDLKEFLAAYDFSAAADSALTYAIVPMGLSAKRFARLPVQ